MIYSLNPCFNGRCTRTGVNVVSLESYDRVLILVLMEDALVQNLVVRGVNVVSLS